MTSFLQTKSNTSAVPEASVEDVNTAVSAAQAAFPAWSALSPIGRGRPLKKMAELVLSHRDELAELDALSMGRPVDGYFDADYAGVYFNYFGEAGYAQGHTSLNTPGFLNMSLRQPFGVVGIIIPCGSSYLALETKAALTNLIYIGNAPLVFFSKKVAPAVAAGNTVVLKSSEKAPLTVCSPIQLRIPKPSINNNLTVLESLPMDRRMRVSPRSHQRPFRAWPNLRQRNLFTHVHSRHLFYRQYANRPSNPDRVREFESQESGFRGISLKQTILMK
jgi:hypothetical protein